MYGPQNRMFGLLILPNLFPIIGCLKEDAFIYHGKEYSCPKHGFIRNNNSITLIDLTKNSLTFKLKFSEETLKFYPSQFEFQIKYILEDNRLTIDHKIINHGSETMLFSLGGHPGFNCPIYPNKQYSDCYIEFEKPETVSTWQVLKNGLIGRDTLSVFDEPRRINLHSHIFDNDALVFKNLNSSKVILKSKKSGGIQSVEFQNN